MNYVIISSLVHLPAIFQFHIFWETRVVLGPIC